MQFLQLRSPNVRRYPGTLQRQREPLCLAGEEGKLVEEEGRGGFRGLRRRS